MTAAEEHRCQVKAGRYLSLWRVMCPTCGQVGGMFDIRADAEAVAARHEEMGGFERRARA